MSLGTILLIILVIALLGGFSGIGGSPFYGTGYYGGGGLWGGLVIGLVLGLLGKFELSSSGPAQAGFAHWGTHIVQFTDCYDRPEAIAFRVGVETTWMIQWIA